MAFVLTREQYRPATGHPAFTRDTWAIVICPGCKSESLLGKRNHTVAADGTVSHSYVCPYPPCTFHEFVKLEGWTP